MEAWRHVSIIGVPGITLAGRSVARIAGISESHLQPHLPKWTYKVGEVVFPLMKQLARYGNGKYFRFYICRGQNEHFSMNSVRKTGRVELCQIFHPSNWCTDICKTIFVILKVQFHHEDSLRRRRYFELFFFWWFILLPQKKSAPSWPIFTLFWLFVVISLIS